MPRPLSDELVEQARVLREQHCLNWSETARRLSLKSPEGIRRRLDPAYRAAKNAKCAAYSRGGGERRRRPELASGTGYHRAGHVDGGRAAPPAHVIAEAERAASAPRTLSMLQFGDPPPGRSALDRMRDARR